MRKIFLSIVLFYYLSSLAYAQQKSMYTQYMFNTLAINPAYSSMDDALTITGLSRQQWVGFKGAPRTQTLSMHTPINESNTSFGVMLSNDQIGEVVKESGGYLTIAQKVEIMEETFLAVGFNGGVSSFRATYSDNFPNSPASQYDPVFQNSKEMRANFGFGVMLFSEKYYVGFSSPHFYYRDFASLGKEAAATAYKPHYMLQAGYLFNLGEDFKLKPNVLAKYVSGSPIQLDFNANLLIAETFWIGASYRTLDSFDLMASFYITPSIQLGYSYDFTNTELAKIQKGSHEVMLKARIFGRTRDQTACYF
ncbi:type IX secretion system membrane protein PorP/SprF [Pseudopedobacter beijingensis]|uniref:Type IX secretion system membrane protein PorP/SprF n=1 Tax=Pseudopedobacter beijingensis TaxID=1207056 RepID=A0ABW4I953_9SPHI